MPRKPKPLSEQSRRFVERAEEIGANATEEDFERKFRQAVPPKHGTVEVTKRRLTRKPQNS
jgi:hypothetical protein